MTFIGIDISILRILHYSNLRNLLLQRFHLVETFRMMEMVNFIVQHYLWLYYEGVMQCIIRNTYGNSQF